MDLYSVLSSCNVVLNPIQNIEFFRQRDLSIKMKKIINVCSLCGRTRLLYYQLIPKLRDYVLYLFVWECALQVPRQTRRNSQNWKNKSAKQMRGKKAKFNESSKTNHGACLV